MQKIIRELCVKLRAFIFVEGVIAKSRTKLQLFIEETREDGENRI